MLENIPYVGWLFNLVMGFMNWVTTNPMGGAFLVILIVSALVFFKMFQYLSSHGY